MHELGLTQSIVEIVAEHANGRKVRRVLLEVGRFSGVAIESIRFCFDLAAEGTALEGALLEIREIEGHACCAGCGRQFVQDTLYTPCPCGVSDVKRISGEEFRVKEYELAEAP